MIRPAATKTSSGLVPLTDRAKSTAVFTEDELPWLPEQIESFLAGAVSAQHVWVVDEVDRGLATSACRPKL